MIFHYKPSIDGVQYLQGFRTSDSSTSTVNPILSLLNTINEWGFPYKPSILDTPNYGNPKVSTPITARFWELHPLAKNWQGSSLHAAFFSSWQLKMNVSQNPALYHLSMYVCTYLYIYTCICLCTYLYIYIYIYTHAYVYI